MKSSIESNAVQITSAPQNNQVKELKYSKEDLKLLVETSPRFEYVFFSTPKKKKKLL